MKELDLTKISKIFFIGIGGIGISALAKMARHRGMEISGVNDEKTGKTIDSLKELGIEVLFKDELAELPDADLYVYSDAWLNRGPEILDQAKRTGKPVLSYFGALGEFIKNHKVIAVSGTHGKTTTTAMLAEVLIEAGLDPTVIVGSFVKSFDSNFRAGNGDYVVVEADEYNRHMLNFHPAITAITNIEADHLDCYTGLGDIQEAFRKFVFQTSEYVVFNGKDENSDAVVHNLGQSAEVIDFSRYLAEVPPLRIPGEHNRKNASTTLAVADILGIDEKVAKGALIKFQGTWRRLEKKGVTEAGTVVYDDYAHHPTEVRASLQGLRELYPAKKITVIFQPHLYSRTKALFDEFVTCFAQADDVLLLPIYFAREDPDHTISSAKLAESIASKGQKVKSFPDFASAEAYVAGLPLGSGDVFVTMGAGEAYKVADKALKLV